MTMELNSQEFRHIENQFLGLIDFDRAFEIQETLQKIVLRKENGFVLGLEHPSVVTLGLRAQNHDDADFFYQGRVIYPVRRLRRGGLATLHEPGQLVIYPLFNLKKLNIGVRDFVCLLFKASQKTFNDFGVDVRCEMDQQPGLYTSKGKIGFCGLEIREHVSMHGLSFNIQNDGQAFSNIESCGAHKAQIDSLKNYRHDVQTYDFYRLWFRNFSEMINS